MIELINISGCKFYYSTIDQVIERCSQMKKRSVIIDENYLEEFLKSNNVVGLCINQIIIISKNVDKALSQLEGRNVLMISAGSFEEAIKISLFGVELSDGVICIVDREESDVQEVINEIGI